LGYRVERLLEDHKAHVEWFYSTANQTVTIQISSQISNYLKAINSCSLFLACSLLSTYPTLFWSIKIRVLPSGTLSRTPDIQKILLRHTDRRNALLTLLEKGGRSEHDKLDRRRSTKLIIPPSSDSRPLQFTCDRLQHDTVARVN